MADRSGVPQRTSVLMDIRANVGGASYGYTGRDGVPQDVDVLMDIRDLLSGGVAGAGALTWRGTVTTVSALPPGAKAGDVWHVTEDGGEYAWDGSEWQSLGPATNKANTWGEA